MQFMSSVERADITIGADLENEKNGGREGEHRALVRRRQFSVLR